MRLPFTYLLASAALAGCTLTADDVEPALPQVPFNGENTVVYHYNGRPVVAHNYSDVASALILTFLGPFVSGEPVQARLGADSTLVIGCVDNQNVVRPGYHQHALLWQITRFGGTGRYQTTAVGTNFRVLTRDSADLQWLGGASQPLVPGPAQVIVTQWNPTTRQISGTFALRFDATGNAPAANLTEGAFDLKIRP